MDKCFNNNAHQLNGLFYIYHFKLGDDGYDLLLSCPDDKYPPPPFHSLLSNTALFFSPFFSGGLIVFFLCVLLFGT
jgi:hypothetical protein